MSELETSSNYHDYWRELTDTICKLIQLTRTITTQHENQRGQLGKEPEWSFIEQLGNVQEECLEIIQADSWGDQKQFAEENLDLLFSTLTTLHKTKLTEQQIKWAVGTCLVKFHKRGWLKFK